MSDVKLRDVYVVVDDDHEDDCVILDVVWKKPKPRGVDDDCVVLTSKPKKRVKDSPTESDVDLLVLGDKGKVFFSYYYCC
jgi:hypothetical protein